MNLPITHIGVFGRFSLAIVLTAGIFGTTFSHSLQADEKSPKTVKETEKKDTGKLLFDGKTLKGWKKTNFGGEGDVEAKKGELILGFGSDLTGVTWAGKEKLPTSNYEITLEAMRVDGNDFFCGMTFPVGKSHCSLIVGGWGGGVCGLSSIDKLDASENETTTYRGFEKKKWYKVRLRVTDERIEAWLDGKDIVSQNIKGRKVTTRGEMDLSKPLGFATWQTTGALKNIRLRKLTEKEIAEVKKIKDE